VKLDAFAIGASFTLFIVISIIAPDEASTPSETWNTNESVQKEFKFGV
jgi:hypothetical protein